LTPFWLDGVSRGGIGSVPVCDSSNAGKKNNKGELRKIFKDNTTSLPLRTGFPKAKWAECLHAKLP
jgi:hypothetical protein